MRFFYVTICYLVYYSGLAWIIKFFVARRKVTIILYHDPPRKVFERHTKYLIKNYNLISLSDYVAAVNTKKELPNYSLIITFDDGHKGNYDLLDSIKQNKLVPTIYICTSIINTNRKFWFRLEGIKSNRIKGLSNASRLNYLKETFNFSPDKEFMREDRQALSKNEIDQMKACVDFQSHTNFHPILTTCSTEEVKTEITESAEVLRHKYGNQSIHFAYPNGDYSVREIEILKTSGYQSARTTDVGWNDLYSDLFRLKITGVSDHSNMPVFKAELSGVPAYLYNIFTTGLNKMTITGLHQPEIEKK